MSSILVLAVRTYPVRGQPPVDHQAAAITDAGLEGDRRKRAPVSLVGRDAAGTRANLVLDMPTADLEALDGAELQAGPIVLVVQQTGNSCRGVYASVGRGGPVAVGDVVRVSEADR